MRTVENPDILRNNIRAKFQIFLEDEKDCINLEKGVFNYALKESDNRKVVKSGTIRILFKFIPIDCAAFIGI